MKNLFCAMCAAMAACSAAAMTRPKAPNDVVDGVEMYSIADEAVRQTVIAEGTASVYQGHPTMCRTADGKRLLAVWTLGHGGHDEPLAESADGGRTWTRVDGRLPASFRTHHNCPSLYRMTDAKGKDRIWIFSARKETSGKPREWMPRVVSEDDGLTWREEAPLGPKFWNVMTFSSVVALKEPGRYLGVYHRGPEPMRDVKPLTVWASETRDGGFTWSDPRQICALEGLSPCEPWVFRSPKGDELCCVLRENVKSCPAYFITSRDEGRTWTAPKPLPWILGMHRHQGVQLKDGRLCVLGRSLGRRSATSNWRENVTYKKFGAWIGTYEQLKGEAPLAGSKAIALLPNYHDCDTGYPGVVLMDDGSVVCCTYGWYFPDREAHKCSVVATRFHPDEFR